MTYTINGTPATGVAATSHFVEWFLSLSAEQKVSEAGITVSRCSQMAVTIFGQGSYNFNPTVGHHRAARAMLKDAGITIAD